MLQFPPIYRGKDTSRADLEKLKVDVGFHGSNFLTTLHEENRNFAKIISSK
jgi:hypothetical protein